MTKIHSTPVKLRQIAPCYAAIQNPAEKFVSKELKPIVKSAPSIIHGSKDLAIKLSQLNLSRSRKLWIITGDVVAFYPNIPTDRCLEIVIELYNDHLDALALSDGASETEQNVNKINIKKNLFKKQNNLPNKDLILHSKNIL